MRKTPSGRSAVALVSAMSLRGRHGRPTEALHRFQEVIAYWQRAGDWTHQWTTLRNLVDLLIRVERFHSAAMLYGALEASVTDRPAFGAEAQRLERAVQTMQARLGKKRFSGVVSRGRSMTRDEAIDFAVSEIDGIRQGQGAAGQ